MPNHDPFAEGADACIAGQPETANPYDLGTDDYLTWNDGWQSQADQDDDDA
ncbi:hypothetical protein [Nitrospirillum amazonense]|uniref:hypothetical protein n=1 Tax=Nitrospirillum amazonense TaxID=28077 RepID=UPI00241259A9|nr:hypothetical protein [Nitrospirillum amazonense]MDG3444628.1 hypothetical protein [Nitrospirillum amazonense]